MLMRIIIINKIKVKFFYSSILCKDTKKTYINTSIRMIVNVVSYERWLEIPTPYKQAWGK